MWLQANNIDRNDNMEHKKSNGDNPEFLTKIKTHANQDTCKLPVHVMYMQVTCWEHGCKQEY